MRKSFLHFLYLKLQIEIMNLFWYDGIYTERLFMSSNVKNYIEMLSALVSENPPKTVKRWSPPIGEWSIHNQGRIIDIPVLYNIEDFLPVIYEEGTIRMSVLAPIGDGWSSLWFMDFNPKLLPQNATDLNNYLQTHIFIRDDYPEKTVPPPQDKYAHMLYIPMTRSCCWMLEKNPYLDQFRYYEE